MSKRLLAVLLTALMVLSLVGCGTSSDSNKNDTTAAANTAAASTAAASTEQVKKDPVTITIWHLWAEDQEPTSIQQRLLKWAQKFNAENTDNITVQVSGSKKADAILTAISAGSTPDIFQNYWNNNSLWADKGALLDLTNYINNDAAFNKADFLSGAWGQSTYKNKIYSVPFVATSAELYYRKDLLKAGGFDKAPTTLEELTAMAIALTKFDDKGNITQMGFVPDYPWLDNVLWPVAAGAKWIDEATNKITFNTPEMQKAYQFQVDIYNKIGYDKVMKFKDGFGKGATAEDPLLTGKIAMMHRAEGIIGPLEQYGANVAWDVAPVPTANGGTPFLATNVFNINAKTKNADAAWKALASMTSTDQMKDYAQGAFNKGQLWSRKSALESVNSLSSASDKLKACSKILLAGEVRGFPMSAYINEYLTAINDEMQKALSGKQTVAEACANVEKKIQPLADANPMK